LQIINFYFYFHHRLAGLDGSLFPSLRKYSFVGGANLSDHQNYWKFGYSAIMVTNTAFFRNHNYHSNLDQLDALNIPKMGLVIDGVFRTLLSLK